MASDEVYGPPDITQYQDDVYGPPDITQYRDEQYGPPDITKYGDDSSSSSSGDTSSSGQSKDADWVSILNTGIKTTGDVITKTVDVTKKNGNQSNGDAMPKQVPVTPSLPSGGSKGTPPTATPPPATPPPAVPPTASSTGKTVAVVGGVLLAVGIIGAAAAASSKRGSRRSGF